MEGMGMEGPAWKRQQMEPDKGGLGEGPAGGSRQDSIFYKTRMCLKCALILANIL